MKLQIEQISNGYILSWEEEMEEGMSRAEKEIIEEMGDEKETMSKLLLRISEYFGILDDKWGKDNLKITWNKKGRKV